MILVFFRIPITENLFPAFQHLKKFNDSCFMFQLERNAPKQYACFFETLFLEAKKTGKLFFNRDSG
jgi:hypothetical protein